MMQTNAAITAATLLGLAFLSTCVSTDTRDHAGESTCRPAAAAELVGQAAPNDATVLRRTRSTMIRRIAPGDATTRDFRQERVTITVDQGRIVAAACG